MKLCFNSTRLGVRRLAPLLLVVIQLNIAATPRSFADWNWVDVGSGSWFEPANWDNGVPFNNGTAAIVDNGGTSVVDAAGASAKFVKIGNLASGKLQINSGSTLESSGSRSFLGAAAGAVGTATITGPGSEWTINSADIAIGSDGTGNLSILNGGVFTGGRSFTSQQDMVGANPTGIGSVTVSGAGSIWSRSAPLEIGSHGHGTFIIENGGQLASEGAAIGQWADSVGSLTVTGIGSLVGNDGIFSSRQSVYVGEYGNGTLLVDAGGVILGYDGMIGHRAGSIGKATISGIGSKWDMSDFFWVGREGTGSLLIEKGATVISHGVAIGQGDQANGSVTVTGDGTTWTPNGTVFIGGRDPYYESGGGQGNLEILDGASVTSVGATFGRGQQSTGAALISGSKSTWTAAQDFEVGLSGSGKLVIQDGAKVTSGQGFGSFNGSGIARYATSAGEVTVTGKNSSWQMGSTFIVGDQGIGKLTISAGGNVASGSDYGTLDGSIIGNIKDSAGSVSVVGAKSTWTIETQLDVGLSGKGELQVQDGGKVTNGAATIATNSKAIGTVSVSGSESKWINNGDLTIGNHGSATLTIEGGGTVSNHAAYIGYFQDGSGAVSVTGEQSTWNIAGDLYVGVFGNGELTVGTGATVSAAIIWSQPQASVRIDAGGTIAVQNLDSHGALSNSGTIAGNLYISGGQTTGAGKFDGSVTVLEGGSFSPGASPGTASTPTTFWSEAGIYQWEINAGAEIGGQEGSKLGWDVWHANDLTIDGSFTIALVSLAANDNPGPLANWNPHTDHHWRIATATSHAFESIGMLTLSLDGFANSLSEGHFWLSNSSDGNDLFLNFTAVPEPSAAALCCAGTVLLAMVRCRRKLRRSKSPFN